MSADETSFAGDRPARGSASRGPSYRVGEGVVTGHLDTSVLAAGLFVSAALPVRWLAEITLGMMLAVCVWTVLAVIL